MSFPGLGAGIGGGLGGGQTAGLDAQQMQEQQMIKYVCAIGSDDMLNSLADPRRCK